jgi:alpha-beta hydrolase superfamily lysophospholipase
VAADTNRIVRTFERVEAATPPVCLGPVIDCEPVLLDGYVFADPGEVGLVFEETTYQSPLGSMGAWLIPGDDSRRWAVHCHGWRAERREMVRLLRPFHTDGRTSLVIDYRNDPDAPADPTGRYRFGLSEWEDVEAAVGQAIEMGAEDLVLSGCSTGGALVMRFLEKSELRSHVSGVVLDAPNIVLTETFRRGLLDSRGSRLLKETALVIADLRWHIDWETTNYIPRARDILTMPTLVFHGTSDQTVPIAGSRRLQAEAPEVVELVETPAGGHVLSWNVDPERYEGYIARFLDRL